MKFPLLINFKDFHLHINILFIVASEVKFQKLRLSKKHVLIGFITNVSNLFFKQLVMRLGLIAIALIATVASKDEYTITVVTADTYTCYIGCTDGTVDTVTIKVIGNIGR